MELRAYFEVIRKKWWIVLPAFLITLISGSVLTYTNTPMYSATATYLAIPNAARSDTNGFAYWLDVLARQDEIATTFSEIAMSSHIKELATSSMSLKSPLLYETSSKLRAGTNVIEITAKGPDPTIVQILANAVGASTEKYVQELYSAFVLLPLDEATTPGSPSSPNWPLNLGLSVAFGLALGIGLVFLSEYLETPLSAAVSVSIIDKETGAYNKEYFLHRLTEEMARARRNHYPLSLGLIRIDNLALLKGIDSVKVRAAVLRQVAAMANQYLREEDIVARLEDHVIAILLPDMTEDNAKVTIEYLQTRMSWIPVESAENGTSFNLKSIVGITAYNHNGASRDELIARACQALQLSEVEGGGKAFIMTYSPNHGEHAS